MKIIIFSINPLFPDKVTGGASKHLYHIASHLGSLGHNVEILCAQSKDNRLKFSWNERVDVLPVLPFHLPFPQPYAISVTDLALMVEKLSSALKKADRFYIHDGEWLIPDVYQSIPTTTSFRDNIYPESILGSFISKADDVICVSDYSARVIEHTAGRFYKKLPERIHRINNGIDLNSFQEVDSSDLAKKLSVDLSNEKIILHPHRPEQGKGLPETIQVVERLVHQYGIRNLKVLIPEWIGEMVSSGDSNFYNAMMRLMMDLGVRKYFKFISWLPIERMPELYSLGDVTLCLGNIVEAFGNVAYESLACGTPSIVSRVGVHRSLLPDQLIHKVHYGDIDEAVGIILKIFQGEKTLPKTVRDYLQSNLDFETQVNRYAAIITGCRKREKLNFSPLNVSDDTGYILAPWCYFDGNRVYHDFEGMFKQARNLSELLHDNSVITYDKALEAGISEEEWQFWLEKNWIVPRLQERTSQ